MIIIYQRLFIKFKWYLRKKKKKKTNKQVSPNQARALKPDISLKYVLSSKPGLGSGLFIWPSPHEEQPNPTNFTPLLYTKQTGRKEAIFPSILHPPNRTHKKEKWSPSPGDGKPSYLSFLPPFYLSYQTQHKAPAKHASSCVLYYSTVVRVAF